MRAARDNSKFFWIEVFWFWHWHWSTSKWLQFGLSHIIQVSISWDKHFLLVSRYLSLWPWPFLKSFTIGGICVLQTHLDCYDYYIKIKGICRSPESNNSDISFLFFMLTFHLLWTYFMLQDVMFTHTARIVYIVVTVVVVYSVITWPEPVQTDVTWGCMEINVT